MGSAGPQLYHICSEILTTITDSIADLGRPYYEMTFMIAVMSILIALILMMGLPQVATFEGWMEIMADAVDAREVFPFHHHHHHHHCRHRKHNMGALLKT